MCYDGELPRTHFLFLNNAMILSDAQSAHENQTASLRRVSYIVRFICSGALPH